MAYKKTTTATIANISLVLASAFASGLLTALYSDPWYLLLLTPVPLATGMVIRTFNQSNRQIAFFFEAIRNEDSALKFPSGVRQRSLRYLYQSLDKLNDMIREIRLKNEYLEQYYKTFIRHAATGLIALNRDNEVEIMNEKAFDYAGIPAFIPLHLIPVKNPDLFQVLITLKPGETYTYRRFTKEVQACLLIRMKEIRFGENVSRLYSLQDIRQELDENELDSWQKLIRVLTHEIMNSIAPIVSLTGTLRKFFTSGDLPVDADLLTGEVVENVIQGLDTIEERGNGLLKFVNSYRKLTRIPKPEFTLIQVAEWLEQIRLLMHQQMIQHDIRMAISIEPKAGSLQGDEKLLTQVVLNILNNAMEALADRPGNRTIGISVTQGRQNRPVIRIANNGPAIPKEIAEKIFVPFFTTRENGSGIGLSLSRQIIRLHKGTIHMESNDEETGFVITL